jgi:two-component system sensor histidine kinase KdpD
MKSLGSLRDHRTPLPLKVAVVIGAPGAVTLLAIPSSHPPTSVIALLYVLAVLLSVRVAGGVAGIAASVGSFLSLNFFFTPPLHTFGVGTLADLVALLVFLVVSATVGLLLSSAVTARSSVERREMAARLMNRLVTRLLSGESPQTVLMDFSKGLCEMLQLARCEISIPSLGDIAAEKAGLAAEGEGEEIPLEVGQQVIGVMRVWGSKTPLSGEELAVLRSIATQLALALEGMRLSAEVRKAELEAHSTRLKAALFSGVTHDVKTPIAAILASATSLIDGRSFSNEERWDHLDTIRQEAERLHRLVNNLLDIARLRSGALVIHREPSPIDELLESVINRLRSMLDGRPVELRVADDIPDVPMDVVQVDQVVTNLLENAIKFTPSEVPISIVAVGNGARLRVTVADGGPGIPKEDRRRIFEPFERGTTTTSGTGLGLAVADAIVQAHGGRMWVGQSPTGGAAFTFELPADPSLDLEEVNDARASAGG